MILKFSGVLLFLIFIPMIGLASGVQKNLLDPDNLRREAKVMTLPKLYNIQDDSVTMVRQGNYLPNRIYTVYVPEKAAWYYSKTNSRGKFLVPMELLDSNSVVPGTQLGGKDPAVHYKLSKDWKWSITKANEEYFMWVLSEPQALKHIRFQDVAVGPQSKK